MKTPDPTRDAQERADSRRHAAAEEQKAEATRRTASAVTRFIDPYDMRAEPQTEEPGYGHGV